ncbi:unnamed protein product [Clonostachys rhizophaga]|uniref:Uncharacterized protein n=1 Tax=Clonostachys rhizophaga TaxID=160324 RepID=A0A9N9VDQ2_9HYPO|nr:unnamed protein product [Clonostachys rhizophaga]
MTIRGEARDANAGRGKAEGKRGNVCTEDENPRQLSENPDPLFPLTRLFAWVNLSRVEFAVQTGQLRRFWNEAGKQHGAREGGGKTQCSFPEA